MDDRVYYFTPGMWEILRYLGAYGSVPIQLAVSVDQAEPADLVYLSNDQEMIDAYDPTAGRVSINLITSDDIANNKLWVSLNGFGEAADKYLRRVRPILRHLTTRTTVTYRELTTAIGPDDDDLTRMDLHGYLELRRANWDRHTPQRRYQHHAGTVDARMLARPGEDRDNLVIAITTKGRRYTQAW